MASTPIRQADCPTTRSVPSASEPVEQRRPEAGAQGHQNYHPNRLRWRQAALKKSVGEVTAVPQERVVPLPEPEQEDPHRFVERNRHDQHRREDTEGRVTPPVAEIGAGDRHRAEQEADEATSGVPQENPGWVAIIHQEPAQRPRQHEQDHRREKPSDLGLRGGEQQRCDQPDPAARPSMLSRKVKALVSPTTQRTVTRPPTGRVRERPEECDPGSQRPPGLQPAPPGSPGETTTPSRTGRKPAR